jgi:hypothetical protein
MEGTTNAIIGYSLSGIPSINETYQHGFVVTTDMVGAGGGFNYSWLSGSGSYGVR